MRRALGLLFLTLAACPETIGTAPRDSGPRPPRDAAAGGDAEATAVDAGRADAARSDAAGSDATRGDATAMDASAPDAAPIDAGPPPRACIVDPFAPCADPFETMRRNDTWPDGTQFNDNMTVGCLTGDDLTPLDRTRAGVLCHNEAGDFYQLSYVLCDTRVMNLELRLHPKTDCDPADFRLFFGGSGRTDCANPPANVRCERDGVDHVIRARVEPGNTVGGWYFGVASDRMDVRLEYDLIVRLQ